MGSPGSGKGTFADLAKSDFEIYPISPGNLLRKEIEKKTETAKAIREKVEKGELIDNKIVYSFVKEELDFCLKNGKKFLLDGFPQSMDNALSLLQFIEKHPEIHIDFLLLEAPKETCIERICSRLICKTCSKIYNEKFKAPLYDHFCDNCHSALDKRSDDQYLLASRRIENYHQKIIEVIDRLEKSSCAIHKIDTTQKYDKNLNAFQEILSKTILRGSL